MTLQSVITALEQATGPSRELDLEIARHLGVRVMKHDPNTGVNYETTYWHYTSKIDDALSLVPEGWFWVVDGSPAHSFARVENQGLVHEPAFCVHLGKGRSAIALCICALRARLSLSKEGGVDV